MYGSEKVNNIIGGTHDYARKTEALLFVLSNDKHVYGEKCPLLFCSSYC